jgi:hypothetical protein
MSELGVALSVTASIIQLAAFVLFNRQTLRGLSKPNCATWLMWVCITVLNTANYKELSGDIVDLLPFVSSIACILTFFFTLWRGKFSKLKKFELLTLCVGVLSPFVWWCFHSAFYANVLVQVALIISMIPTYRDVWREPESEDCRPWLMWAIAYGLFTGAVATQHRPLQDLIYPINGIVIHAIAGVLALRKAGKPVTHASTKSEQTSPL